MVLIQKAMHNKYSVITLLLQNETSVDVTLSQQTVGGNETLTSGGQTSTLHHLLLLLLYLLYLLLVVFGKS